MNPQICDVLLIDDEPDLRGCIADLLEDEKFHVIQTENGKTALEILQSGLTPKVIVLDYMMPIMDGKTFCEHILKDLKNSSIPIILLSAANIPEETIKAMNVSAQMEKPIRINAFIAKVKSYVQ